jgi:hypothetical protein
MKTYTIAGYSNLNGRVKPRVATGSIARRRAVLKSAGHTDINLVELPEPMTREIAAAYIAREFAAINYGAKVPMPDVREEFIVLNSGAKVPDVRDQFIALNSELNVEFTPESVAA